MAFLSPGSNFVAQPADFSSFLQAAPEIPGTGALTQAVAANQTGRLQLLRDALVTRTQLEAKEIDRQINQDTIKANQEAAKKQAAMQLLSGLGSVGGGLGGGGRKAGEALIAAGLLNDDESSPAAQLQSVNDFMGQVALLNKGLGNAGPGGAAIFTANALRGTG